MIYKKCTNCNGNLLTDIENKRGICDDCHSRPIMLHEIQSMHEQREQFNFGLRPLQEGHWIEVINFDYNTEAAEVKMRLEVKEIHKVEFKEVIKYRIVTKKLDVEGDYASKEVLAQQVLEKHHAALKASFCRCLIDGISSKSVPELKGMIYKLGGSKHE